VSIALPDLPASCVPIVYRGPVPSGRGRLRRSLLHGYTARPNEVTSRSMVNPLRRKDFTRGVVVTSLDEAL
jgi:hypothetical protein